MSAEQTTVKPATVYIVKPRPDSGVTAKPRLVRAARRSAVESYTLQAFTIERATVDDAVACGAEGIEIEEAGE